MHTSLKVKSIKYSGTSLFKQIKDNAFKTFAIREEKSRKYGSDKSSCAYMMFLSRNKYVTYPTVKIPRM